MEIKHITRVAPLSLAKFLGCLYSLIGLIAGVLIAFLALVGAGVATAGSGGGMPWAGAFFGVGAVVFLPILYGMIGVVGGLIVGFLFNLVAGMTGGLEIGLE